jgi:uncharacterized protein (DUF433 family)
MPEWQGFYSTSQVSRLARIPRSTLYEWKDREIIAPSVTVLNEHGDVVDLGYSYADLTIIKIMRALREDRLDLKSVHVALRHLFERLGPPSQGWADAHVYIVENKVYAEKPDEWDVTAATQFGQKAERRLFGEMFEELHELEEPGAILIPKPFRPFVQINPAIMGGEPVVRKTRIPTFILATLRKRGRSLAELAKLYRPISKDVIEKAIEYEEFLDSAIAEAGATAA